MQRSFRLAVAALVIGATVVAPRMAVGAPVSGWVRVAGSTCSAIVDGADRLPDVLSSASPEAGAAGKRGWGIADIIEAREILDLALSDQGRHIAFIVKQACIRSGETRFGLYMVEASRPGSAKKLVETAYLADLSLHPGTRLWTVRADLGAGVQLYDVDNTGRLHALVINADLADWGGEISNFEIPHKVGILSYDWAPDGSALWYSKPVSPDSSRAHGGVVFDSRTMQARDMIRDPVRARGRELHYFHPASSVDRTLAVAVGTFLAEHHFRRDWSTVKWHSDSRSLDYRRTDIKASGEWENSWWNVDVESGESRRLGPEDSTRALATGRGSHLALSARGDRNHLVEVAARGQLSHDYGPVTFERIGRIVGLWRDTSGSGMIVQVSYKTNDGLVLISGDRKVISLPSEHHLGRCVFDRHGKFGACVRESLTLPPEVVAISPTDGRTRVLARPNVHYDDIAPLVHAYAEWTNRYGNKSDGYITYPRNFVQGRRYPTIVITHGRDVGNKFAFGHPGRLWDFHVNVFAERGYLVLAVNEAPGDYRPSIQNRLSEALEDGPAKVQFELGLVAVATMEAALGSVQHAGVADLAMTGIAGWSRGGEVVQHTMTQSKMFRAGVLADGYWGADAYWASGLGDLGRALNRAAYGGSPYDANPTVVDNYRKFAAAFRARQFAGPALMLFAAPAHGVLELRTALSDAGVPNELVFFPREGHIFWNPRNRAAAMQRSLEWFDYWLRGVRDPDPAKADQYLRWDTMAVEWRKVQRARAGAHGGGKQDH